MQLKKGAGIGREIQDGRLQWKLSVPEGVWGTPAVR